MSAAKELDTKRKAVQRGTKKKARTFTWKWFSKYVKNYRWHIDGDRHCISCGKDLNAVKINLGHFVPKGAIDELWFKFKICYLQCARCNMNQGNPAGYIMGLYKKIGVKGIMSLAQEAHRIMQTYDKARAWSNDQIIQEGEVFKQKYLRLAAALKAKGITPKF